MKNITITEFEELLKSNKPIVLDFYADWCAPCKAISPIINELSEQFKDTVNINKVNIDDSPDLASKFGVRNIPTVLFIKNGEVIDKQVGATSKKNYEDKINKLL